MVILHVSAISGNKSSGMSVVVPEHVKNQSELEKVAMFNCADYIPENSKDKYKVFLSKNYKEFDISKLKKPFNQPDLVIFHGIYIFYYIKIYKDLKKHNIPYIIVPHGSLTKNAQKIKRIKKIVGNIVFFNEFIKNAIYIQYLSQMEKNESCKYTNKNIVIGNGINVPDEKLKKYSKNNIIKLTYIGRLDLYFKGLDVLVDAINCIQNDIRERKAVIELYGPINNQAKKIQNLIKKYRVEDILKVNNAVYGDEKEKILLNSDIFIQVSRTEGQPLGIMEAMAYGLPCLVTPGTTFKDIVEKNKCGYTTELTDLEVAKKILYAIDNYQDLEKLSQNAYNYAKNELNWKKVASKSIEKYKEIISEG